MAKKRRPTMKDVAAHAGVSLSTVSYVVNDSGPVASDRVAELSATVAGLGFGRPNIVRD